MSDLARRRLVPELLDELPAADPAAIRSRADLRRINALMGNAAILASLLRAHCTAAPTRLLEIGSGDGSTTLRIARRLAPHWPGVRLTLLDMNPSVSAATLRSIRDLGWEAEVREADAFAFLNGEHRFDAAWANLVLHHFEDVSLRRLLGGVARSAALFVATETRRSRFSLAGAHASALIGANHVTRHDAPASVRAGFRDGELSALWPGDVLEEERRGPFTHAFAARGQSPVRS